jgi:hypothetical protein
MLGISLAHLWKNEKLIQDSHNSGYEESLSPGT